MIPVWSDKTVLEIVFVESTSFIWPIYMALQFKNVYNYTAFLENPSGDTRTFDIRRDIYPGLKKLP